MKAGDRYRHKYTHRIYRVVLWATFSTGKRIFLYDGHSEITVSIGELDADYERVKEEK